MPFSPSSFSFPLPSQFLLKWWVCYKVYLETLLCHPKQYSIRHIFLNGKLVWSYRSLLIRMHCIYTL